MVEGIARIRTARVDTTMQVGFIGLGTMGAKMAANLQRAGYRLVVNDVRREAAAPHLESGAQWADTPRQVAAAEEVVFTSLPAPADVEAVALGSHGILGGIVAGGVYFDLSTNSPTLVRRLCASFAERGAHFLDAPVSGGPRGAKSGRLAIWVGGERAISARSAPARSPSSCITVPATRSNARSPRCSRSASRRASIPRPCLRRC